jgi:hypothetical protein
MGRCCLGEIEHAVDIGPEGAIELLRGQVLDLLVRGLERGVVNQDIEPAELGYSALDQLGAMSFVANVARNSQRAPSCPLDPASRFLRVFVLVQIRDHDIGGLIHTYNAAEGRAFRISGRGDRAAARAALKTVVRAWKQAPES